MNVFLGVLLFLAWADLSQGAIPASIKTKYHTYLQEFDNQRGHVPNSPQLDVNRKKVTDFMKSKFEAAGLIVHLQDFSSTETSTKQAANGTNIIAVLPGSRYKTAEDQVVILAAHIDTYRRDSNGLNNDGSGLMALLVIAERLAGADNCTRNNSVIFAAFDRSETGDDNIHVQCNRSCGSIEFIKSKSTFIGSGKVQLTLVMDCLANFDSKQNSQEFSKSLEKYFKDLVTGKALTGKNGDFLAISGRNNEAVYLEKFKQIFERSRVEAKFLIESFLWNINGAPSAENRSNLIDGFKDGDQISFWDENLNAILVTDTCYDRGYMDTGNCKTDKSCDTLSKLNDDSYGFMYSTISTAAKLTSQLVCSGQCASCGANARCNKDHCVCQAGFTGDGLTCTDIDECLAKPCSGDHEVCVNSKGHYTCMCQNGFKLVDAKCIGSSAHTLLLPQLLIFGLSMLLTYFWL